MPALADFIERTIVVVDDSPRFRSFVVGMLNDFGFRSVQDFADPDGAFDVLTKCHVDLVMSDLGMEPSDGFAFSDRIRHGGAVINRMVPILLMTGHASRQNVQKAVMSGIDEIAVKPMSSSYLAERLLTVFGRPRVYVKTSSGYFGPDRRRRNDPGYHGPERRTGQTAEILSEERLLSLRQAAFLNSRGDGARSVTGFEDQPYPADAPDFSITHIDFRKKLQDNSVIDMAQTRPPVIPVVVRRSRRPRDPAGVTPRS